MDERTEDGGIEAALGAAFLRLMEAAQRDHRLSTDIALICQKLAEEGVRSIPGTRWLVGLLDTPHSDSLRVVASAGEGVARLRDTVWPLSGTLAAEAMSGGRSQSAPASVERLGMGAPLPAGVQFALALPLYPHDHGSGKRDFHGCLLVLTEEGGFRDVECRLADAFANIINLAVTRAEVRLRLREAASRLETGVEVAVDLAASLNPLDVIHRLVQRAVHAVDADRAGVYQVDADDLVVEGSHDASGDTAVEGVRASLFEQPLFLESRTTRQAVRGGPLNIEALPETLQAPHRGVRHSLVLPLLFGGDVVGFIGAFRRRNPAFSDDDVATLRVIANVAAIALRNARLYEAAAAAREGMSSFLNLVVHELRSPLTVIAGYIDMLQTDVFGKGPAGWERPLGTMAAKTKEMQSLVDDLLFAARLEHGRLPMVSVRFDLREAALRSVERALPRATMMGASVEAVTGERGTVVEADREHVDRILDNLINNALDYGGDQPSVRVVVGEAEPTVAVEDRGPGISKDLHERVFERFFRIEGAGRRSGTGLGLHISRRLAMECRGSLDLDYSEAGKGSRFILRLPSANGAPKGSSRSRSAPRPSDRSAA